MRKFLMSLAAISSVAIAAPSMAATTIKTFTEGNAYVPVPGESVFATFNGGDNAGAVGVGTGFVIQTGGNGLGADPQTGLQGDPYLSVLGNGEAVFSFSPLAVLGLDYGSADSYNTFYLTLLDGTIESFTGQDIINSGSANGDQASGRTNGRLTFTNAANPIVGLRLTSELNSLEVDNFSRVAAVPEPGTWAMMLLGFGAIGTAMRRRRRQGGLISQVA